ncbi:MAG TPA: hypothetical protein PKM65_14545 [Spirochaetota bacterium]|nr:hypothetical protein [Spirochaetota bacterium]HNT10545.1 hypothetical protein [Spirochaetota bacterium]HNV47558.1 hypothetical protein [Spirochaetota bacterium]HOS39806.1 hypothetical protein [Spirochaetota bacterium]HPU88882.1 hypothetical protein [Spirochaetota bacterium]
MNPLVKIASGLISTINRIIDSVDTKTADGIRQGFFFVIFLIAIGAVIMGYRLGSGSAKRTGIPLAESTNQVFEIDIKRQRDHAQFNTLLDTESVRETERVDPEKNKFLSREGVDMESSDRLAEPDSMKKKSPPAFDVDTRSRIAEIDRTGDTPRQSGVRGLPRRESVIDRPKKPELVGDEKEKAQETDDRARDIRDSVPAKTQQLDTPRQESKKRPLVKMRPERSGRSSDRQPGVIDR